MLQARELYLLESANLAANLQGMADVVSEGDQELAEKLLRGVLALKTDLDLAAVAPTDGIGLAEFTRASGGRPQQSAGTDWRRIAPTRAVLDVGSVDRKRAGWIRTGERTLLAIASPICAAATPCRSIGVAVVGLAAENLLADIEPGGGGAQHSITIYDPRGALLASSGSVVGGDTDARPTQRALVRRTGESRGTELNTLYAPLMIDGKQIGIVGVALPTKPVLATTRSVALRLTFVILAVLIGIMGVGAIVSRHILRQVRPLVETNRALGQGDLSARAPVFTGDEIGEVARGLNQMAEQLQASHETLESRVAQRTEEVQRLLRDRTEFFASLSHELRTPLAIILNESDALLDTGSGRQAMSARAIKMSGAQLLAVVNEILELAKAEVGRLEINMVPVAPVEAVADALPTFEGLARSGSLRLEVQVPDDLPSVAADPRRLHEILLNLVDNAVKYTPAGGTLRVSATHEESLVRFEVADTGPGIPPEVGSRIFDAFFQVKGIDAPASRASSGLGLALTRKLVEAHGGRIWYEDRAPGTSFFFTIPLAPSPRTASRRRAIAPHVKSPPAVHPK